MSQTLASPASIPPDLVTGRVVLHNISWDTYSALLQDIGDAAARLTYDRGLLEIELPSRLHEQIKKFMAVMAERTMEKRKIKYEPAGAATWRKQFELRGLEADECYHVQSVTLVSGKSELNLLVDPPPDLAIAIAVTPPAIDKVEIYRTLRVLELWRIKGDASCEMFRLDSDGRYQPIQKSVTLPLFTPAVVSHYLLLREQLGHSDGIARFEAEMLHD